MSQTTVCRHLEPPLARFFQPLPLGGDVDMVFHHVIQQALQMPGSYFGAVLEFERAGSQVAGIGVERFAVDVALAVEFFKFGDRQDDLPPDVEQVGIVRPLQAQGNAADGASVGRDVIALHAVPPGFGAEQAAVAVGKADRSAVVLEF